MKSEIVCLYDKVINIKVCSIYHFRVEKKKEVSDYTNPET